MSVIPDFFTLSVLHQISKALTGNDKLNIDCMQYPREDDGLFVSFTNRRFENEIMFKARMVPATRGYELLYGVGPNFGIYETIDSPEIVLDFELIEHLGKLLREWKSKPDLDLFKKYKPRRNQFTKRRPRLFFCTQGIENESLWMGKPDQIGFSVGDEVNGLGTIVSFDRHFYKIKRPNGTYVNSFKYETHRKALVVGSQVLYNHPDHFWPVKGDSVSEVVLSDEDGMDSVDIRTGGVVRRVMISSVLGVLQWGGYRTPKKISSVVV